MINIQISYKQYEDMPAHLTLGIQELEDTVDVERKVAKILHDIFTDAVESTGLEVECLES